MEVWTPCPQPATFPTHVFIAAQFPPSETFPISSSEAREGPGPPAVIARLLWAVPFCPGPSPQ